MSLDLSGIYKPEAKVREYLRTIELNREKGFVTVSDSLDMKDGKNADITITLYSPQKAVTVSEKQIVWQNAVMTLENILCSSVRKVDLSDEKGLAKTWGDLYCITLTAKIKKSGIWKISFHKK